MSLIDRIKSPDDLRSMSMEQLDELSAEIRTFLVDNVTKTGGHLGPNLGVVELTLAVHRIFDSPRDPILWDTGHQTYVHKIVTGRAAQFPTLRQDGGLSGYPSRAESIHDVIENSHASTALSYADGIAKAFELHGETDRHVVAVIGDGALTGGMTWEAINNIASAESRSLVIVVNDNERSYSPTIGGLATKLAALRTHNAYEEFLGWGKQLLSKTPLVGRPMYEALHGMKKGIKDVVAPQGLFEDLGMKYIGPVDGHNIQELEFALTRARDFGGPVIVHAITQKGRGYAPAELDEADRFHAVGIVDPDTGKPVKIAGPSWTSAFSDALLSIGHANHTVVAITAAMLGPTGLEAFNSAFPTRTFDVGIAEQHAVASAAGMAHAGLNPVVAVYSTFLNRAFDQVLMDSAMHRAGVTFVLDRAGITGDDGASHNGMWDMSLLTMVPGLDLYAPRDAAHLAKALQSGIDRTDGPVVLRFPKGALPQTVPVFGHIGPAEILTETTTAPEVTIVAIGSMCGVVLDAASELKELGLSVEVIDPVQSLPVSQDVIAHLAHRRCVVTVEDGLVDGGVGQTMLNELRRTSPDVRTLALGIPKSFLRHASRATLLNECGLDAESIATSVQQVLGRQATP
jgi:1-deoxy-D-xylulose-5-phosphate synthase